jgi:hypothetical protein
MTNNTAMKTKGNLQQALVYGHSFPYENHRNLANSYTTPNVHKPQYI